MKNNEMLEYLGVQIHSHAAVGSFLSLTFFEGKIHANWFLSEQRKYLQAGSFQGLDSFLAGFSLLHEQLQLGKELILGYSLENGQFMGELSSLSNDETCKSVVTSCCADNLLDILHVMDSSLTTQFTSYMQRDMLIPILTRKIQK